MRRAIGINVLSVLLSWNLVCPPSVRADDKATHLTVTP
jgi:hypothetical protein